MAEQMNQENQKTIVSFVVGLLIGGLLVWAFSEPAANPPVDETPAEEEAADKASETTDDMVMEGPTLVVGEGNIAIADQPAGTAVTIGNATYPVGEGWIGVREFNNEELGYILGVSRFSQSQGLVPETIELVRATTAGNTYAIVVFEEDGDFDFSLAGDAQIDTIFDTFTAQ